MSERSTFEIGHYTTPQRVNETVLVDDTVSHIDILLPFAEEAHREGLRWVDSIRKTLRLHRIDERSLVLSDLSSIKGGQEHNPVAPGIEHEMPFDVMDVIDGESVLYGRDHNPAELEILANPLVSREHFKITSHLGSTGLKLSFEDERSTNGSTIVVVRHEAEVSPPAYDNLFVA
jgi:hypothetical protein